MRKLVYLAREAAHYLKTTKRWWLLPILVVLALLVVLVLILETASTYPIIYPFL